jgi:hypothetical protein
MMPNKKRELDQYRWLRDHADEAAASLLPGDIRTPAILRRGAQKMIDLIEGRLLLPRRRG